MSTTILAACTAAYSGGFVTVLVPGSPAAVRLSAVRSVSSVAVGDQVLVTVEGARMWVTGLLGTAPPPPPPPPPPDPAPPPPPPEEQTTITGTTACTPTWTGSFRGGAWRSDINDVRQGTSDAYPPNRGAAFYGRKPSSLGTSLTGGRVRLVREKGGVFAPQTPTMLLLAGQTRPASFPSVLASAAGPALATPGNGTSSATWTLPAAWLASLNNGTAGGIGVGTGAATPHINLDGPSMTLTLDWERTT